MSESDAFEILGIDHLHLIAGNAYQAAYFYRSAFGFALTAWRGPGTGTPDHISYVLERGGMRLVLSSPLTPDHPTYDHIRKHGDGIRDVAFAVDDPAAAWRTAVERGAEPAYEPSALEDGSGVLRMAGIRAFGDTIHSFIGRKAYGGAFRPGYVAASRQGSGEAGPLRISGLTAYLSGGELQRWSAFYERILGFTLLGDSSPCFARLAKGLSGGEFAMALSAAGGEQKGEAESFLNAYQSAGIGRVRVKAADASAEAARLKSAGVVLAEGAGEAVTEPVHDRPTLRFEIAGN
jgi:4-hydroxyphenylpyruvate dioxygenase